VGFNYSTNPYSYFHANYEEAYDLTGYWRLVKPRWVLEEDYNNFIIGSSRSQSGFDPETMDQFLDGKTYNMAMPGMGYYEAMETANYIMEHFDKGQKMTFVIALDAYMMPMNKAKARNEVTTWKPKRYNAFGRIESYLDFYGKVLLSRTAIDDSIDKRNSEKKPTLSWQKNGFSRVGLSQFKSKFIARDIKKWKKRKKFVLGERKLEYLTKTLDLLNRPNVEAHFIIPPIHNVVQGLFEEVSSGYQQKAKLKLVQTILEHQDKQASFHVYDYLIANSYNGEILDGKRKESDYFRDLSHMRSPYGDEILEEVLSSKESTLGYHVSSLKEYKAYIKKDARKLQRWLNKNQSWVDYNPVDDKKKKEELEEEGEKEVDDDFIE